MKKKRSSEISARRRPLQARSRELVGDILEAAIRVLKKDGARGFTTVKVADEAGVSVGSLYQYFPNKQAILFRLQTDEWQDTGSLLFEILEDDARAPMERLRRAVKVFFRSEREEADLRRALADASALYQADEETAAHRGMVQRGMMTFLEAAIPSVAAAKRELAADVVLTTMSAIGKQVSEEPRTRDEVDSFAEIVGEWFVDYLEKLERSARKKREKKR